MEKKATSGIMLTLLLTSMLTLAFSAFGAGVHDVAITNVIPSKTVVIEGDDVLIYVTVENQGDYTENFNVTAYIGALTPEMRETFWSMGDTNRDGYTDQTDIEIIGANWLMVVPPGHPADLNSDGVVDPLDLVILGANFGWDIWSYFGLLPPIGKQTVVNLAAGISTTLAFVWDTTSAVEGSYTISALATSFVGSGVWEVDRVDNHFIDGTVQIITTEGTMYFEPATVTGLNKGDLFTLTVMFKDFTNLYTWQVEIGFDPAVLMVVDFQIGPELPNSVFKVLASGRTTLCMKGRIDNTAGYIYYSAEALTGAGGVTGTAGTGYKLMKIDFKVVGYTDDPLTPEIESTEVYLDRGLKTFWVNAGVVKKYPATQVATITVQPTPHVTTVLTEPGDVVIEWALDGVTYNMTKFSVASGEQYLSMQLYNVDPGTVLEVNVTMPGGTRETYWVTVTLPGDIGGSYPDGVVDGMDLYGMGGAWGTWISPPQPPPSNPVDPISGAVWNPNADITGAPVLSWPDGSVNALDLNAIGQYWGMTLQYPPHRPEANFFWTPINPNEGETITFDASASTSGSNGTTLFPIVEYRWDFNGDSVWDVVAPTPITTWSYPTAGYYPVTLEVWAPGAYPVGIPDTDSITKTVQVIPPP